jgi:hypothetical protein
MAMDKINGSHLSRTGGLDPFSGPVRSKKDSETEADRPAAGPARNAKPADTMEISEAAHRLVDLRQAVDTGRAAIEALPEIRDEKVELARKRLGQGFYNSQAVRDEVAAKLGSVLDKIDEL